MFNIAESKLTHLRPGSDVATFRNDLEKNTLRRRKLNYIDEKLAIIGEFSKDAMLFENLKNFFVRSDIRTCSKCYSFTRLYKNGIEYDSKSHKRQRKIISYFVKYKFQDTLCIGIIEKFVKLCRCNCRETCANCVNNTNYYAILQKCNVQEIILQDGTFHFICLCEISNEEMIAIDVYV